jgi:hypothetical protein
MTSLAHEIVHRAAYQRRPRNAEQQATSRALALLA